MAGIEEKNLEQIEYLVHQSTQGFHYLFSNGDIVSALKKAEEEGQDFFTFENRNKVQSLLLQIIERHSFADKQDYLETLNREDYELVIQAYFHLVDNTILAKSSLKH